MSEALLEVENVSTGYGKIDIVFGASLGVAAGEIVSVIGPNGAGKSTLLKAIAGVLRCSAGDIRIKGETVANRPPSEVARLGLAYVPQEANVFRQMTVDENLTIGGWVDRGHVRERRERVLELFPDLRVHLGTRAGNLSGGQRQMVAFGMALMVAPSVLLLDEPSAGLSPKMVAEMFAAVKKVNATGVAVLMIEQNAIQALDISHRGVVMAGGEIALIDDASALLASENVSELYLGTRR
ncbi:ABC transporter ATP-binding protein [Paralimibaculum aggregatum]|uniref:ABC transporter ATP-binding protein n=1 Tax=Paralimibaculum aggregatum TaxID=3036245 RepID=A0ABQ6LQ43_9RHOB|nr:ABC transporter ATP-binding protein [Limibaculum sp. NKW23]GMG84007.1 ABC transporter ATP-binding protein [Limibaculum sp. NKW23]